ncbi:hypothetical protein DV711_07020 [Motiliproteus coralliicola]|uniref:Uncharacterized protein n=2 Tax=Motiliproteus coralliicola TaxID=2283196 RepID=A0A369WP13_9GAMM|nr:hypothetical protein DV711_07020 [Motiliproteus coralliicola]
MKCMFENMKLYFKESKAAFVVDTHECTHSSNTADIKGGIEEYLYQVVYSGSNQTVLLLTHEREKEVSVEVVNWTGFNSFWIGSFYDDAAYKFFYKLKTKGTKANQESKGSDPIEKGLNNKKEP